jgi:hypothetical protein
MAFHDQAIEAEEDGAVVVVRVEVDLEQVQRRPRQSEAGLGPDRALEGAAQQVGDEAGGALRGLERDVARKAVASLDIAISAPVLPADRAASARPSLTALIAIPIEVVRARRIAWLGFSLASIRSGEWATVVTIPSPLWRSSSARTWRSSP